MKTPMGFGLDVRFAATLMLALAGAVAEAQEPVVKLSALFDVSSPVGIVNAGDGSGRLFVVTRPGIIRVYADGQLLPTPFLDISAKLISGGEQGLLGLAFHPDYASNGFFFVDYTRNDGDTVIARYAVSQQDPNVASPDSELILLVQDQPASNHNGGDMHFAPDGSLLIAFGDGGGVAARQNAQNLASLLGKILRLDVDNLSAQENPPYDIPAGNPFVGVANARDEVWAWGLRNPWRFSFDRETGELFIADVGESNWEEVDVEAAGDPGGRNYGWPLMEGDHCFPPGGVGCNDGSLTTPVLEYDHGQGCAITGGRVYRGLAYPQFDGQYFFGDYCSGNVWRAARTGQTWNVSPATATSLLISSFGEGESGELYVADLVGSKVYRIDGLVNSKAAFFRSGSWGVDRDGDGSLGGSFDLAFALGDAQFTAVVGDWDGDGRASAGVYRDGAWLLDMNGDGVFDGQDRTFFLGFAGATPVAGDWNGDGRDEVGVYAGGFWFLDYDGNGAWDGGASDKLFPFGFAGASPVTGDWNGDGNVDVGVYANGFWFLDANGDRLWDGGASDKLFGFGWPGAQFLVGDWDGDGSDSAGVYSNGFWFLDYDGDAVWDGGTTDRVFPWGWPGVTPVLGDWNGDGRTKAGVFIDGLWLVDYDGNSQYGGLTVDRQFFVGGAGDTPLPAAW